MVGVVSKVAAGYRIARHPDCPWAVHRVLEHCWAHEPSERPSFSDLAEIFDRFTSSEGRDCCNESHDCDYTSSPYSFPCGVRSDKSSNDALDDTSDDAAQNSNGGKTNRGSGMYISTVGYDLPEEQSTPAMHVPQDPPSRRRSKEIPLPVAHTSSDARILQDAATVGNIEAGVSIGDSGYIQPSEGGTGSNNVMLPVVFDGVAGNDTSYYQIGSDGMNDTYIPAHTYGTTLEIVNDCDGSVTEADSEVDDEWI